MEQTKEYPTFASNDKRTLEKWYALRLDSTHDEAEGMEHLVTTLYAKPGTGRPFLNLSKLKKSVYEETTFFSLNSYLLFSDIGHAAWKAALELNKKSTIGLACASLLEEDKSWQVMIKNPDLTILLNSTRFRPIGKYTSAFYISIEIGGKPATLLAFIKAMMGALNRKPWEDESGELDWGNFTKKTFMSRKEVIEQWALLSDLPELFPDSLKETTKPICQRCKKTMEIEWILCPFCGEPSKNYHGGNLLRS